MAVMIVIIYLTAILVPNVYAFPIALPLDQNSSSRNVKPGPVQGAFEGDIILPRRSNSRGLVGIGSSVVRWPNGIVPYEIAPEYTADQEAAIVTRMRKLENLVAINNVRCIQFRPRVSGDLYYIRIINSNDGCYSPIGQSRGNVSLNYPGCFDDGRTFHELLHTLGFLHEQSRMDRDTYVRVNLQNIKTGLENQFQKYGNPIADTFNTSYDYSSVMHYKKDEFSLNNLLTIEPIRSNIKIGQRYNLSLNDIQLIRRYYNCSATGPTLPPVTIPITPASPSMILTTYASELTNKNPMYARNGSLLSNYYYEIIQTTVSTTGSYIFKCHSNIDTFAYLYDQPFDPLNPAARLRVAFDDDTDENWEFAFSLNFVTPYTFIFVVTTYNPNVTGPFLIAASGSAKVNFTRIGDTVQPTTTKSPTTTTTMTTTTTKTTTMTTTTTKSTTTTIITTTKTTTTTKASTTSATKCSVWNPNGTTVAGGNGVGPATNQLNLPFSMAVTSSGDVYVADTSNFRIQLWKKNATEGLKIWPPNGFGSGLYQMTTPTGLYLDPTEKYLYIMDAFNYRVVKVTIGTNTTSIVAGGKGTGVALDQLSVAWGGLTVDSRSNVYISDGGNARIMKWAPDAASGQVVAGGNGAGIALNQLSTSLGNIVVDSQFTIFVADAGNLRIQMWRAGASSGITLSPTTYPIYVRALALDSMNNIYIGGGSSIMKWNTVTQTSTTILQNFGNASDQLISIYDLRLTPDNTNLFAVDGSNYRIQKYSLKYLC